MSTIHSNKHPLVIDKTNTTNSKNNIHRWSSDNEDEVMEHQNNQLYKSKVQTKDQKNKSKVKEQESSNRAIKMNSDNYAQTKEIKINDSKQLASLSIAERTHNLYKMQQQTKTQPQYHASQQQDNSQTINDIESHRVMYQFLFTENKRKDLNISSSQQTNQVGISNTTTNSSAEQPSNKMSYGNQSYNDSFKKSTGGNHQQYISALNTRRNPDVLVPGALFLKGNMYFKDLLNELAPNESDDKKKEEGQVPTDSLSDNDSKPPIIKESEPLAEDDDAYEKMKNQTKRYFIEENPTIKCRNCLQFGHMARECTNQAKRPICILCGKDTHDSFQCSEKTCFKCNKVGHVVSQCTERNIIKCNRCGLNGHKEIRCLKVWKGDYSESQLQLIKCIECGQKGHIKCTKERKSWKIEIDTTVHNDLHEFIENRQKKFQNESESDDQEIQRSLRFSFDYADDLLEENKKSWINQNTNLKVPDKKSTTSFGIPRHHDPRDIYCCYCADRHSEDQCPRRYSGSGNQKYQQFEKTRERFSVRDGINERDYYSQGNNRYNSNNGGYNNNNKSSYHLRLANDPRRNSNNNYQSYSRENYKEYGDEEEESDPYQGNKYVRKVRNYEQSSESGDDYSSSSGQEKRKSKKSKQKSKYRSSSEESGGVYSSDDDSEQVLTNFTKLLNTKKKHYDQDSDNDDSNSSDNDDKGGSYQRKVYYTNGKDKSHHQSEKHNKSSQKRSRSRRDDYQEDKRKHHKSSHSQKKKHKSSHHQHSSNSHNSSSKNKYKKDKHRRQ